MLEMELFSIGSFVVAFMPNAKIALVHDWLTGMRGGEKCLEIACRTFPDARLYTLLHVKGSVSSAIERLPITTSFLQRIPTIGRHYRYFLPWMPRAIESLKIDDDTQVVISFSHAVAKSIAIPPGAVHLCYCFTPMRYAWSLRDAYFARPGSGRWRQYLPSNMIRRLRNRLLDRIRDWDAETAGNVTQFIAISRAVADRIQNCYRRESEIIHPPVDTDFFTPIEHPRDDFYLCFSALVPYKRIDLAIAACRKLNRQLVVIGTGPELRKLRALAGPDVRFLGWQSDESVRDHLRRCRALLFPGEEDFGIVPLEAQACGAPVIALEKGGALETIISADEENLGTGLFFSESSVESLCDAILRFENLPNQFPALLARQQALRFDTHRFTRQLTAMVAGAVESQDIRTGSIERERTAA